MGIHLSRTAEIESLDGQVLSLISEGVSGSDDGPSFDELAVAIFRHQWAHHPFLRRVWSRWISDPQQVSSAAQIPPIPHAAFKYGWVAGCSPIQSAALYRTSGTTGQIRGRHGMDTLDLYRAASLATFRHFMLPDGLPVSIHALLPSPSVAPESSLSAMVGFVMEEFGDGSYWFQDEDLDDRALIARLREEAGPTMLLGTSFAFIHLCDRMAARGERLTLPEGSRVMETGGFKGRTRDVARPALLEMITERLGIPSEQIVNEYGMTELSSQLYTSVLVDGCQDRWSAPPWLRVRALDPDSREDVSSGEVGVLAFVDLANRGSAVSVLTADLGRVHADGKVSVIGRASGLSPRGCSWAVDETLSSPAATPEVVLPESKLPSRAALQEKAERLRGGRTRREIANALGKVSQSWLRGDDPFRLEAIAALEEEMGFSREVIEAGLDASFRQWAAGSLWEVVESELGGADDFESEDSTTDVIGIIAAGNVPTPVAFDMMSVLLVGAAALVRPSSNAPSFPDIFRRSIAQVDPLLADSIEIVHFGRDQEETLASMGRMVDVVVANGSDETMEALREGLPDDVRLIAHGTRISMGLLSAETLRSDTLEEVAMGAAMDVALWDQRGCLSPVVWFVEEGVPGEARHFAQALQRALDAVSTSLPAGRPGMAAAATLMAVEDESWIRRVGDTAVEVIGDNVIVAREPAFSQNSHRRIQVFPISSWDDVLRGMRGWHGRVATATLAATPQREKEILAGLAPIGATRICQPGEAQSPPASWHQDGISVLHALIQK